MIGYIITKITKILRNLFFSLCFGRETNKIWVFRWYRTVDDFSWQYKWSNRHICININDANKHLGTLANIGYFTWKCWCEFLFNAASFTYLISSSMFTIQMCTVSHLLYLIRVRVQTFVSPPRCWVHLLLLRIRPLSEERLTKLVECLIPAAVQQVSLSPVDSWAQQILSLGV